MAVVPADTTAMVATAQSREAAIRQFNEEWTSSRRASLGSQYQQALEQFNARMAQMGEAQYPGQSTGGFSPTTGQAIPGAAIYTEEGQLAGFVPKEGQAKPPPMPTSPIAERRLASQMATTYSPNVQAMFFQQLREGKLPMGTSISQWAAGLAGIARPQAVERELPADIEALRQQAIGRDIEALASSLGGEKEAGLALARQQFASKGGAYQAYEKQVGQNTYEAVFGKELAEFEAAPPGTSKYFASIGRTLSKPGAETYKKEFEKQVEKYKEEHPEVKVMDAVFNPTTGEGTITTEKPIAKETMAGYTGFTAFTGIGGVGENAPRFTWTSIPSVNIQNIAEPEASLPPILQHIAKGENVTSELIRSLGEGFRQSGLVIEETKTNRPIFEFKPIKGIAETFEKTSQFYRQQGEILQTQGGSDIASLFGLASGIYSLPEIGAKVPESIVGAAKFTLFVGYAGAQVSQPKSQNEAILMTASPLYASTKTNVENLKFAKQELVNLQQGLAQQLSTPEGAGEFLGSMIVFEAAGKGLGKLATPKYEVTDVRSLGIVSESGLKPSDIVSNLPGGKVLNVKPPTSKLIAGEVEGRVGAQIPPSETYGGEQIGLILGKKTPSPIEYSIQAGRNLWGQIKAGLENNRQISIDVGQLFEKPKETILGSYIVKFSGEKFAEPRLMQDRLLGALQKVEISSEASGTVNLFMGKQKSVPVSLRFFSKEGEGYLGELPTVDVSPGWKGGSFGKALPPSKARGPLLIGQSEDLGIQYFDFGKMSAEEQKMFVAGYATTFEAPKVHSYMYPENKGAATFRFRYTPESTSRAMDVFEQINREGNLRLQHQVPFGKTSLELTRLIRTPKGIIQITEIKNPFIKNAIQKGLLRDYSISTFQKTITQTPKGLEPSEYGRAHVFDILAELERIKEVSLVSEGADPFTKFIKVSEKDLYSNFELASRIEGEARYRPTTTGLSPRQMSALNRLIEKAEQYERLASKNINLDEALGAKYIVPPETSLIRLGGELGKQIPFGGGPEPNTAFFEMPKKIKYVKTLYSGKIGGESVMGYARAADVLRFETPAGEATLSTGTAFGRIGKTQKLSKPVDIQSMMVDVRGTNIKSVFELRDFLKGEGKYKPIISGRMAERNAAISRAVAKATAYGYPEGIAPPMSILSIVPKAGLLALPPQGGAGENLPPIIFGGKPTKGTGVSSIKPTSSGAFQILKENVPTQKAESIVRTHGGQAQIQIQKAPTLLKPIAPSKTKILSKIRVQPTRPKAATYNVRRYDVPVSISDMINEGFAGRQSQRTYGGVDFNKYGQKPRLGSFISSGQGQPLLNIISQKQGEGETIRQKQTEGMKERFRLTENTPEPSQIRLLERFRISEKEGTTNTPFTPFGNVLGTPPPPPPPIKFALPSILKKKQTKENRGNKRKFKLTSDIVSQAYGITAKKYDISAAITGLGLRPKVKHGRT